MSVLKLYGASCKYIMLGQVLPRVENCHVSNKNMSEESVLARDLQCIQAGAEERLGSCNMQVRHLHGKSPPYYLVYANVTLHAL